MPEYHVNPLTGKSIICRSAGSCDVVGHYPTREEAENKYVATMTAHLLQVETKFPEITDGLRDHDVWSIPDEVLRVLSGWITESAEKVLAVVPSGSLMYNTVRPNTPMNDYDFMVFVDDDEKWKNYRHCKIGLVDLFIVPLRLIESYASYSQIIEGWAAIKTEQYLFLDESFKSVENSGVRQSQDMQHDLLMDSYFRRLEEYLVKYESGEYPDSRKVQDRKHMLRWKIYLGRDSSRKTFNPRLTGVEREGWLIAINQ